MSDIVYISRFPVDKVNIEQLSILGLLYIYKYFEML